MSKRSRAAVVLNADSPPAGDAEAFSGLSPTDERMDSGVPSSKEADRVALLILGMHRSGTSAVTRLLSMAGAGLPQELIEAGEGNRLGHWESRPIALYNDDLLKQMGIGWSDWQPVDWSALSEADASAAMDDIAALVAEQFDNADLIVLKDPRICRLVPLYTKALTQAAYRVVAVLPYRNPAEVIDSLMARSHWPIHAGRVDAALLWLTHVLEAEYASRSIPRIFVDFADVLSDWQSLITDLEVMGDLKFTAPSSQFLENASGFIDRNERHQRRSTAALTREHITSGWIAEVLGLMTQLQADPLSATAMARLDTLREALAGAMPMLHGLAVTGRTVCADLDRARTEVAQAQITIEMLREDLTGLRADREGDRRQSAALREDNTILREDMRKLQAQAAELRQQTETQAQTHDVIKAEMHAADEAHASEILALHDAYRNSTSWRMTAPLRGVRTMATRLGNHAAFLRDLVEQRGGWRTSAGAAIAILSHEGVRGIRSRLKARRAAARTDMQISYVEHPNADYVNSLAAGRGEVLLSDWHTRLLSALNNHDASTVEGAIIGLSLVTYNSDRWLPGFFASLLAQSFPLSRLNVFVVDHCSTDATRGVLQAHCDLYGDRYASFTIHERPNNGFGAGHDYAIRQLSDDFVLVSNVDLEFHADTIDRAVRAALADRADVATWELRQCPYEHPKYYDPVTLEAVWSSHACVLVRRAAYLNVGGYDDRIFMYGEDVELSYRLRAANWRLRYLPQVSVTHHVELGNPTVRPLQLSGSVAANVLLRHRFGGPQLGAEGETLLAQILQAEHDPRRRQALTDAQKTIARDRVHFQDTLRPECQVLAPFTGFDYVIARDGADVRLQSDTPLQALPKVTIVTRTHGPRVGILREAVVSVLNQTYPNIEHLIVEDRTDFAAELVDEIARTYGNDIRYLKSDGAGRSAAGNFGLANAAGELMMFLDNDDLLFPEHVEILVRALDVQPERVGAYTLAWDTHTRYEEDGRYYEVAHSLPAMHRLEFDRERLERSNFIPIQSMLFRRSLFDREGGFDSAIDHLEDWNLWSRYARYGEFTLVKKVTSLYRTPADPEVRERRQAELDGAYDRVREMNRERKS